MPNVNNVAPLLNYINKQAGGIFGPEVTDLDSFVSMGNEVIRSDENTETFTNTFFDTISKTIDQVRSYTPDTVDLINNSTEWGAILRTIDVDLIESRDNPAYSLTEGQSVDQNIVRKPTVYQSLYTNFNAWEYDITIPDVQWKTAFKSPEEMQAVINGVFTSLQNSKSRDLENAGRMAYANLIGENVRATSDGNAVTVINLLSQYNTNFNKSLTPELCIFDPEFNRYATYVISDTVKTMQGMTTLYNVFRRNKWTPRENMRVMINSQFASACKMYLQSDVFYKDLVELPKYSEIPYWQSVGNGERSFADSTEIAIRTASGYGINQKGIIAVIADDEAVGICKMDERTTSHHNARGEYTNYFSKCDMGYYNNMRMQSVIFVVAPVATPAASTLSVYVGETVKGDETPITTTFTSVGGESVVNLSVGSTTLVADTDYTVSNNVYTFPTTYLDDLGVGDTIVKFTLSNDGVIPFVIRIKKAES